MWPAALRSVALLTGRTTEKDPKPASLFDEAVTDAEFLLKYAAESGIEIESQVRDYILQARTSGTARTDEQTANLLTALTTLAGRLKPVTAESLKVCAIQERLTIGGYWLATIALASIIVPFSVLSFVTAAASDAVRNDIASANELAVKLTTQLEPMRAIGPASTTLSPQNAQASAPKLPPGLTEQEVATELQQFASETRAIYRRAQQLNIFVGYIGPDPFAAEIRQKNSTETLHKLLELSLPLQFDPDTVNGSIRKYQDVRYFAQTVTEAVSFWYGAFTACLLPVLYALLGTCAYLMRYFEEQIRTKTYVKSVGNSTRFLIAGIGGAVVGLFNSVMITKGPSIPPFAIAFLVGYSVDVFFSFLESLLQTYTKAPSVAREATRTGAPGDPPVR